MAWYDEAVFYHIYPLGMTGAPKQNPYGEPVPRLRTLLPWIAHIRAIGCTALYIGPLFESVGHGYETTDYKKLDGRLGTNGDLKDFVAECHRQGVRVILDGVFNHTGRDFFAFRDIREKRENSPYRDWYCHVNFGGSNAFGDGFSYENWGGYDLLAKLNQHNGAVRDYICDVVRFWVREFDIDGIRLDAADVMDFGYMKMLRQVANEVKPDFWLMGEVIHGNYGSWANGETIHSVTNYMLHKALYSAHNDRNYFEIAHTVKYVSDMTGGQLNLYTFADNHDVERIYTKLKNKAHFAPVHILLYTLPGIPSVYYGSEFGIEGRKMQGSDDSLRPALAYEDWKTAMETNPCTRLIAALGRIRRATPALCRGTYREVLLQNTCFAFERVLDGKGVIVAVNNADGEAQLSLPCGGGEYVGALSGERLCARDGRLQVRVPGNYGEIWIPAELCGDGFAPAALPEIKPAPKAEPAPAPKSEPVPAKAEPASVSEPAPVREEPVSAREAGPAPAPEVLDLNKPYEEMSIAELQEAILEKMRRNGPVTDYMLGTVRENTHHGSLLTWVRSFR